VRAIAPAALCTFAAHRPWYSPFPGVRRILDSPGVRRRIKRPDQIFGIVNRMCPTHLFLTCCKWLEFHRAYSSIIPRDCAASCRELTRRIRSTGVVTFRNQHLGHIHTRAGRPLTDDETIEVVERIVSGDDEAFADWCAASGSTDSFVSIVQHVRDRIADEWSLSREELFPRLASHRASNALE
jgi:hypothetical protein